jgi:glycerol kinase
VAQTWEPRMAAETRASLIAGWHKAIERSFGWA